MQLLDDVFGQRLFRVVDHIVNGAEVVDCLDDIVNRNSLADIDCVRFKNQPGLILAELAAFNVVGIVCHADLKRMVQAAGHTDAFFITQHLKQHIV